MLELQSFLVDKAENGLLAWSDQQAAMERFGLSCAEVEEVGLVAGILPARYQRNRETISTRQQLTLLRSCVGVIGCGGLGCYVLEELARLGVGRLIAIDPDIFEENNLNRQLFSSPAQLGRAKVAVAAERIAEINPAVNLLPVEKHFTGRNGAELLASVDCAVDALDNAPSRLELAAVCRQLDIPFVHAAIAGWYGHVTTVFPGESTLEKIYGAGTAGHGVEAELGNPSFTPALVASLEVAEVCKLLLGQGELLRNRKLLIDLLEMQIDEIQL